MKLFSIKCLIAKAAFCASALMLSFSALSQPMYYQFEGNVTSVHTETSAPNFVAESGIGIGDFVSYIFRVDRLSPGVRNFDDGRTTFFNDESNSAFDTDYFYAELVSNSYLSDGGYLNNPSSPNYVERTSSVWNRGFDRTYTDSDFSPTQLGSLKFAPAGSQFVSVYIDTDSQQIGSTWNGSERINTNNSDGVPSGSSSFFYSSLNLVAVSDRNPALVPELDVSGAPVAFALISGIAGIAYERRRRKTLKA